MKVVSKIPRSPQDIKSRWDQLFRMMDRKVAKHGIKLSDVEKAIKEARAERSK